MRYKFTDKEVKEILDKMVVLIDSRENANMHITDWLKKKKRPFKSQKLDYGDYSCYLPIGTFEGQKRDIYFTNDIVIERKFCIDEIAMNLKDNKTNINEINQEIIDLLGKDYLKKVLKTDYNRLKYEFANMNRHKVEFFIFMENENFDLDLRNKVYRAEYSPDRLYKRIKGVERDFHTILRPVSKENSASEIYNTLRYQVRNILVYEGLIEDRPFEESEDK
ncbi:ERCC4-type nuclease [Clostridium sp. LY3-2]|uniref:ERCC4-type nuclease n=1 Tax=Clostridium sp. LY3-2 TaxID=2942482 RepID=UPI00215278D1|nr:ERCC4-type nuclease [Clostridium sp. LY3-2]MCR6516305.1 ERCC4-type nuclease [Clostridium sp. LY3-2]